MSMGTAVRSDRYILADIASNSNKFWNITLFDDHRVETLWGRVGEAGQRKAFPYPDPARAAQFYESKCREKERKGYRPQRTVEADGAPGRAARGGELAAVAREQIAAGCPVTAELVAVLARENIHQILSRTTMTYDTSRGTFSTPLGIVTQDAILEARRLLTAIGSFVAAAAYDNPGLTRSLNDYLMIVPQDIGRRRPDPRQLYPDLAAVQRQNDLLDALDASLQQVVGPAGARAAGPRVFDCSLSLVEDGRELDRIRRKYRQTQQSIHGSSLLDVRRAFLVEIAPMRRAFEQDGLKLSNVWELWHGTKKGNLLSILSRGFVIPPSNAPHCTGRLFGNGCYFSDQSTKSLNYSWGHWDGKYDPNCFMFLCNVGMGRFHVPKGAGESLPKRGSRLHLRPGRQERRPEQRDDRLPHQPDRPGLPRRILARRSIGRRRFSQGNAKCPRGNPPRERDRIDEESRNPGRNPSFPGFLDSLLIVRISRFRPSAFLCKNSGGSTCERRTRCACWIGM